MAPGALTPADLDALLARPCPSCGRAHLRARALAPASMDFLEGEPVSSLRWTFVPEELAARVYRVECEGCGAALHARDDCPRCRSRGGLERALAGRHGLDGAAAIPAACPRCDHPEVKASVEARMHLVVVQGRVSRRVADAAPGEGGFHVTALACPSCEEVFAEAPSLRCATCGRSSLLKRPG